MKKSVILTIMVIFASLFVQAQKPRLYIEKVTKGDAVTVDEAVLIRQGVIDALTKTQRFDLFDEVTIADLEPEIEKRQKETSDYILNINATTLSTAPKKTNDGKTKYSCVLNYSITLTDAKTQTTIGTKVFDHSPTGGIFDAFELHDTKDKAIASQANLIKSDIEKYLIETLPITGVVCPADYEADKDKLKKCYIYLGSNHGVKKGDRFVFVTAQKRAGRTVYRPSKIRIEVEEVVDVDLALCKVQKEHKDALIIIEEYAGIDEAAQAEKPLKIQQVANNDLFKF